MYGAKKADTKCHPKGETATTQGPMGGCDGQKWTPLPSKLLVGMNFQNASLEPNKVYSSVGSVVLVLEQYLSDAVGNHHTGHIHG